MKLFFYFFTLLTFIFYSQVSFSQSLEGLDEDDQLLDNKIEVLNIEAFNNEMNFLEKAQLENIKQDKDPANTTEENQDSVSLTRSAVIRTPEPINQVRVRRIRSR